MLAQRREAAVHLGGDGARMRPGLEAVRPEPLLGIALGDVLQDREAFPDAGAAVDQERHLAGRRMTRDVGRGGRLVQRHDRLRERDVGLDEANHGRMDQDE